MVPRRLTNHHHTTTMITLTIDGSGAATDDSCLLTAGRRYIFQWASDVLNAPSTGTLTAAHDWEGGGVAVPSFRNASGTAYSYDLAAVTSGAFEFTAAYSGLFRVLIAGGSVGDIAHFTVAPIL